MNLYFSDEFLGCCRLIAAEIESGSAEGKTVSAEDDGLPLAFQIN